MSPLIEIVVLLVGMIGGFILGAVVMVGSAGEAMTQSIEEWEAEHPGWEIQTYPSLGQQYVTKGGPISREMERYIENGCIGPRPSETVFSVTNDPAVHVP